MVITHKIKMDLSRRGLTPLLNMVQGDSNTRAIEITLLNNGSPWEIPAGTTAVARYQKKGGAAGLYDIMEDGSNAWSVTKPNVVTIYVASQVLTQKGSVFFTVSLVLGNAVISMFHMVIEVEPCSGYEGETEEPEPDLYQQILQNYVMLTCRVNNLSTLKEGSTTGDAELQDVRLGYNGQIYANAGEAVRQQVAAVAADIEEVRQSSSVLTATEKNLILRLLAACVYTSDQSKTVQALQQTFESTSNVEYTVTNNLENVSTDNNLAKVTQYAAYVATLTPADGYELDSVTVLMGGVDVTESVYADGEIYIPVVTGAIVITANAVVSGSPGTSGGELISNYTEWKFGTAAYKTFFDYAAGKHRLVANLKDYITFNEGDTITLGDYSTYAYGIGKNAGNNDWIGGDYKTADYTLTSADLDAARVMQIKRLDGANMSQADLDYINANAKVVRA